MPLYEVQCKDCNEIVEVLVKSFKSNLPNCKCGGKNKRLISTPAFMFAQPAGTDKGRLIQISSHKALRT